MCEYFICDDHYLLCSTPMHRYLYYLQLKHLILNGELDCSNDLAVKLASYALQGTYITVETVYIAVVLMLAHTIVVVHLTCKSCT